MNPAAIGRPGVGPREGAREKISADRAPPRSACPVDPNISQISMFAHREPRRVSLRTNPNRL